jgi:catechol 2,3-dioxygenase-like lactoylglutathione lyase family enzyme
VTIIEHVVLYSSDSEATIRFYGDVMGFPLEGLSDWRLGKRPTFRIQVAEHQFINVHPAGSNLHPRAAHALPGGLDVCFLTDAPIDVVVSDFERRGVSIEVGPVARTTSVGHPSASVYVRDPDGNLVEVMSTVHE